MGGTPDGWGPEHAVLVGGPRCGQEVPLREYLTGRAPTVQVTLRPAWLGNPAALLSTPDADALVLRIGVYAAPWVDGGWSRDDAGRLRLTWRGER